LRLSGIPDRASDCIGSLRFNKYASSAEFVG